MEEIIDNEIDNRQYEYTFKTRVVLIWAGVFLLSILFEVLSWGGRSVMWLLSTGGLTAYAISGMIVLKGKNTLNTILFIGGIIWTIFLFWGMFFNDGYPYNNKGLNVYLSILGFFLIIYILARVIKKRKWIKNNI